MMRPRTVKHIRRSIRVRRHLKMRPDAQASSRSRTFAIGTRRTKQAVGRSPRRKRHRGIRIARCPLRERSREPSVRSRRPYRSATRAEILETQIDRRTRPPHTTRRSRGPSRVAAEFPSDAAVGAGRIGGVGVGFGSGIRWRVRRNCPWHRMWPRFRRPAVRSLRPRTLVNWVAERVQAQASRVTRATLVDARKPQTEVRSSAKT